MNLYESQRITTSRCGKYSRNIKNILLQGLCSKIKKGIGQFLCLSGMLKREMEEHNKRHGRDNFSPTLMTWEEIWYLDQHFSNLHPLLVTRLLLRQTPELLRPTN